MLNDRALYFANLNELAKDDPFEGSFTKPMLALETMSYKEVSVEIRRQLPRFGKPFESEQAFQDFKEVGRSITTLLSSSYFVNSWHMNDHESAAMWKVYLKSNEGVAIQSTVQ